MNISIIITGNKETRQKMKKLGAELTKLRPELDEIGDKLESYYSGHVFASQGGAIGKKWKRLDVQYATVKHGIYPGRPPLVKTGKMIGGFRHKASQQELTVYNRMPYFKYHQSSAPRKKIPYRPMMAINDDAENIIKNTIQKGIHRKLDGVRL